MKGLFVVGVLVTLGQMPAVAWADDSFVGWIDYEKLFKDHASEVLIRHDKDGDHATITFPDGGFAYRSGPSDKPVYGGSSKNHDASCMFLWVVMISAPVLACPQMFAQDQVDDFNKRLDQVATFMGMTAYPPRSPVEMRAMMTGWVGPVPIQCDPKNAEWWMKSANDVLSDRNLKYFDVATIKPSQLSFDETFH